MKFDIYPLVKLTPVKVKYDGCYIENVHNFND